MRRIASNMFFIALLNLLVATMSFGQDKTPIVRKILDRYVEAVGGEELLSTVKTLKTVSTVAMQQKVGDTETKSEYTTTLIRSKNRWVRRNSLGHDFAFDGKAYWMKRKNGEPVLQDAPRYPFDFRDPISYPLHLANFSGEIEYQGKAKLNGKSVYRLTVEPVVPVPELRVRMTPRELLFDVKSGLLLKIVFESKTVELKKYREASGVLVPFQYDIDFNLGDISSKFKLAIDSLEFDIEIDEDLLSLDKVVH